MQKYDSHYINGQWVKAQSTQVFEVHDSSTEEVFATVAMGTRAEAEQAVMDDLQVVRIGSRSGMVHLAHSHLVRRCRTI